MHYIALYWHILALYFRRYVLKEKYENLPVQLLDLPDYQQHEHLYKSNSKWNSLDKNLQTELLEVAARLQENPIYIALVEEERIEIDYLPILSAVSEGIVRLHEHGIEYNFAANASISYCNKGLEELSFFQDTLFLVKHWILPFPLYKVFEYYIQTYSYYGAMDIKVKRPGSELKIMPLFYNLIASLLHIHSNHQQLLEVYWQSIKGKGFSDFYKTKYHIPFLSNQKEFEEKIRQVNPSHFAIKNIDFSLSANKFIDEYDSELPNIFLDKYYNKNLSISGNVCENNFIKLWQLIQKMEKQQIFIRPYVKKHFGIPFIKIAYADNRPRIKVYLNFETFNQQKIVHKGQMTRFTAVFVGVDETGLLLFETGIL